MVASVARAIEGRSHQWRAWCRFSYREVEEELPIVVGLARSCPLYSLQLPISIYLLTSASRSNSKPTEQVQPHEIEMPSCDC